MKMRFFILALCVWTTLFISSCGSDKLDTIEFVDSFVSVQKSIIEFDSLLTYSNKVCKANYSFSFVEDTIEIRNAKFSDDRRISLKHVCPVGKPAVKRLQQLTKILSRNHITYVYKLYGTNVSVFGYYYSYYTHGHEIREIIVDKHYNASLMGKEHKPLDGKGSLILFAIRE
jgi:hypothetical protein